jgi:hypothetical protein
MLCCNCNEEAYKTCRLFIPILMGGEFYVDLLFHSTPTLFQFPSADTRTVDPILPYRDGHKMVWIPLSSADARTEQDTDSLYEYISSQRVMFPLMDSTHVHPSLTRKICEKRPLASNRAVKSHSWKGMPALPPIPVFGPFWARVIANLWHQSGPLLQQAVTNHRVFYVNTMEDLFHW